MATTIRAAPAVQIFMEERRAALRSCAARRSYLFIGANCVIYPSLHHSCRTRVAGNIAGHARNPEVAPVPAIFWGESECIASCQRDDIFWVLLLGLRGYPSRRVRADGAAASWDL